MEKKHDIVIFGMNKYRDWLHHQNYNRSYYVLQQILSRHEVGKILFVDYLPVRRKNALVDFLFIIVRMFKKPLHLSPFSVVNVQKQDKLFTYASVASVINWKFVYQDLKKILQLLNFSNIIIWSYDPLNVDFFDQLDDKLTIFDLDSDWRSKENLQHGKKIDYVDVLRKNYNSMSDNADFIFTASDDLMEVVMGHKNSYWVTDIKNSKLEDCNWKDITDEMFKYITEDTK